jgi:hypothetical protein
MDDGLADLSDLNDLTNRVVRTPLCGHGPSGVLLSMFDCTSRSIDDDQGSQC